MRKTGWIAVAALSGVLAGCGGEPSGADTQQAAEECDHQQDGTPQAWQPAALVVEDWQPPTQPAAVGDEITVGDWTMQVDQIEHVTAEQLAAAVELLGQPPCGMDVLVVRLELTYTGPAEGGNTAELQSVWVARDGTVHPDLETGESVTLEHGQTVSALSIVPVSADQVEGGYWGIGLGEDPAIADLTFVQ